MAQTAIELSAAGRHRPPAVTASPALAAPIAFGLVRREVCVPSRALSELPRDQQRGMLAHEIAHVRRRDPLWRAVGAIVECALWFQPLSRLASRELEATSELACDDWAAEHARPLALAECLATVAGWIVGPAPRVPVAAMARAPSDLRVRVERLAAGGGRAPRRAGRWMLALAAALCAVAVAAPGVADPRDQKVTRADRAALERALERAARAAEGEIAATEAEIRELSREAAELESGASVDPNPNPNFDLDLDLDRDGPHGPRFDERLEAEIERTMERLERELERSMKRLDGDLERSMERLEGELERSFELLERLRERGALGGPSADAGDAAILRDLAPRLRELEGRIPDEDAIRRRIERARRRAAEHLPDEADVRRILREVRRAREDIPSEAELRRQFERARRRSGGRFPTDAQIERAIESVREAGRSIPGDDEIRARIEDARREAARALDREADRAERRRDHSESRREAEDHRDAERRELRRKLLRMQRRLRGSAPEPAFAPEAGPVPAPEPEAAPGPDR